ncbi:MAG: DUF3575 domain-containing protein [Endomicrobiia bacterium]
MKKIIIFLVLSIYFLPLIAQEKTEKIYGNEHNAIYVNVIPLFIGQINAHYERLLSDKLSVMFGLGAASKIYGIDHGSDWSILVTLYKIGIGIYPAGRYGKTLRGVYFMPKYTGINVNAKYKPLDISDTNNAFAIGIDIGHRWVLQEGLMFDLSIGMGFVSDIIIKADNKKAGEIESRVGITHIGLQFGYAW